MNRRTAIGRLGATLFGTAASAFGTAGAALGARAAGEDPMPHGRSLSGQAANFKAHTVALSHDGALIAAGGRDLIRRPPRLAEYRGVFRAYLWDASTGRELLGLVGEDHPILAAAFSPDDARVALGGVARIVYIARSNTWSGWDGGIAFVKDTATGQQLGRFSDSEQPIRALAIGPRYMASIDEDHIYRLFDTGGTEVLALTDLEGQGQGQSLTHQHYYSFSADATRAAAASTALDDRRYAPTADFRMGRGRQLVKLWDADSVRPQTRTFWTPIPVSSVAVSPDGSRFLIGGSSDPLIVYDFETHREIRRFEGTPDKGFCSLVTWSPDGRRIAYGDDRGRILVWDSESGRLLREIRGPETETINPLDPSASMGIRAIAFTQGGLRVVSGGFDSLNERDPESGILKMEPMVVWDARLE